MSRNKREGRYMGKAPKYVQGHAGHYRVGNNEYYVSLKMWQKLNKANRLSVREMDKSFS